MDMYCPTPVRKLELIRFTLGAGNMGPLPGGLCLEAPYFLEPGGPLLSGPRSKQLFFRSSDLSHYAITTENSHRRKASPDLLQGRGRTTLRLYPLYEAHSPEHPGTSSETPSGSGLCVCLHGQSPPYTPHRRLPANRRGFHGPNKDRVSSRHKQTPWTTKENCLVQEIR